MRKTFFSKFQVLQNDDDDNDDIVEWGVKMINENSSTTPVYTATAYLTGTDEKQK